MRSRRILLTSFVVVIIVALVLSAVTISVEDPARAQGADPGPITVPAGSLGDRVVYAHYALDKFHHLDEFRLGQVVETRDRDAAVVQAVEVEHLRINEDWAHAFDTKQLVGLHDRLVATTFWESDDPNKEYHVASFWKGLPVLRGLDGQGRTLELGQTLEWRVQDPLGLAWYIARGGGAGAGSVGVPEVAELWSHSPPQVFPSNVPERHPLVTMTAEVAHTGMLGEELVYGIHVQGKIDTVASPHDQHHRYLEAITVDQTYWFSGNSPYPLMIEYDDAHHWSDGKTTQGGFQLVLVEHEPGTTPIPWGQEPGDPKDLETMQGPGLHLPDGTGKQLDYPLSLAIEDAFGPTVSLEWALWRAQNPEPLLVSTSMYKGSLTVFGAESIQWRLVFQGEADAYEVLVERDPRLDMRIVEGIGASEVPQIKQTTAPARLTVSALLDLWQELHPEESPDYLHWGLVPNNHQDPHFCPFGGSGGWWDSHPPDPDKLLSLASIGQATYGPCHQETNESGFRALVVDVHEPVLMALLDEQRTWDQSDAHEPSGPIPHSTQSVTRLPQHPPLVQMGFPDLERGAVIAAPLLVVLLTAYFFPAIQFAATKGLLIVPAFSRIKRSQVLDHELRDRLHALIRENPAITPTELKKATGVGWGTIVHHLAVMEREGLIASRIEGRHRRFFLADEVPPSERASLAVLANHRTQEIYTDLLDNPGLATPELASRVGLSSPGALWHLKRLEGSGLVQRRRDGRYVRYYPSQDFRAYDPRQAVEVV